MNFTKTNKSLLSAFREQNQKSIFSLEIRKIVPRVERTILSEETQSYFPKELLRDYDILEQIGEGVQGVVFKIREKTKNQILALKCIKSRDREITLNLETEFLLAKAISHPSLIAYHNLLKYDDISLYCFVMEYSDFIPLRKFLAINPDFFHSETNLKKFFQNLISVVYYLHKNKIIHRDIKTTNILISPDGESIKLLDFGVAKKFNEMEFNLSPQGDFKYRAPEIKFEGGYNENCDIWSCGLVLYSILLEKNITTKKLLENVDMGEEMKGMSKELNELLKKMNCICPKNRISAEEILLNPWLH